MNVKRFVQVTLLIWFLVVSVAILVPSYQLLFGSNEAETAGRSQPPTPPPPPPAFSTIMTLDPKLDTAKQAQQVEGYKQQVGAYAERIKGYTQEVAAYTQQVAAYKTTGEAQEKSGRRGAYELVVKGSLITVLGGFATTLLGLVFANLGAGLADNMIRMRNNHPPQSLTLW